MANIGIRIARSIAERVAVNLDQHARQQTDPKHRQACLDATRKIRTALDGQGAKIRLEATRDGWLWLCRVCANFDSAGLGAFLARWLSDEGAGERRRAAEEEAERLEGIRADRAAMELRELEGV